MINLALLELQADLYELKAMGLSYDELIGYIDFYSDFWVSLSSDLPLN